MIIKNIAKKLLGKGIIKGILKSLVVEVLIKGIKRAVEENPAFLLTIKQSPKAFIKDILDNMLEELIDELQEGLDDIVNSCDKCDKN